jgi:NadR type nicotinamide-nucleotide adenylyltransferase
MEKEFTQQSADLVKVVIFGPESTGKTTLSRQLAAHYKTIWVPEFARAYLQKKWDTSKEICQKEDILPIAKGQIQLENKLVKEANKILICDTDVLETKVYSEQFYNGFVPTELDEMIKDNEYNLYLLTYIDTPWIADDLRDRPNERKEMFTAFENALQKHNKKYILLKGNKQDRFQKATLAIDELFKEMDS